MINKQQPTRRTPLQLHAMSWKACERCDLQATRNRVALVRGTVPADVLFLGDGPSESDNVTGQPWTGPAGYLLDHVAKQALGDTPRAFTHLLGCIPRDDDGSRSQGLLNEHVISCSPRVLELVRLVQPKLVVCCGKEAWEWTDPGYKHAVKLPPGTHRVEVQHPGKVLAANIAQRGLMVQRMVVTVRNAAEEYCK